MNHEEFKIGEEFMCANSKWRCTDLGTRTVIAIQICEEMSRGKIISGKQADAEGWYKGPPYAVMETVFDENDIKACTPAVPDEHS